MYVNLAAIIDMCKHKSRWPQPIIFESLYVRAYLSKPTSESQSYITHICQRQSLEHNNCANYKLAIQNLHNHCPNNTAAHYIHSQICTYHSSKKTGVYYTYMYIHAYIHCMLCTCIVHEFQPEFVITAKTERAS